MLYCLWIWEDLALNFSRYIVAVHTLLHDDLRFLMYFGFSHFVIVTQNLLEVFNHHTMQDIDSLLRNVFAQRYHSTYLQKLTNSNKETKKISPLCLSPWSDPVSSDLLCTPEGFLLSNHLMSQWGSPSLCVTSVSEKQQQSCLFFFPWKLSSSAVFHLLTLAMFFQSQTKKQDWKQSKRNEWRYELSSSGSKKILVRSMEVRGAGK